MTTYPRLLLVLVVASSFSFHVTGEAWSGRDWRYWPFSSNSPWNHPLGSGAVYAPILGLVGIGVGLNYNDRWTSAVVVATATDPVVPILFSPSFGPLSNWTFLDQGGLVCGNAASVEATLVARAGSQMPHTANTYSTTSASCQAWSLPPDFHPADRDFVSTVRLPTSACSSPDSDGLMAVVQPDGWVLDTYASIVLSNGTLLTPFASYIDARGDGTGWWNGRRASMLPSFAGLIRTGEIASGRIPHALAATLPASLLTSTAVWPAYAFDRNCGYSGTVPMGSLLAIPASVNLNTIGLSPRGKVIATAAQNYGIYVVDRGGAGLTLLAELGNPDIRWESPVPWWRDMELIRNRLMRVTNNTSATRGGGGVLRAPLASPLDGVSAPRGTGS